MKLVESLGSRGPCRPFEVILVDHPIQPLTQEEVYQRADAVFAQLVAKLTRR
ncbi:MAG: hypothetical protein KatS3mg131_2339 [Candidatus Tectimicrobiota bacterium]|nr:MAG: hypothetical protein KatS3mg131_2339 [Candidatus Tectomicrobia bacterium]